MIDPVLEFFVPGVPQVQGNHRVGRNGRVYDANTGLRQWREDVARAAEIARLRSRAPRLEEAVYLGIEFVMPRTKAMRDLDPAPAMVQRPDSLKLARAVEDALAGIVYPDDSFITRHYLEKRRARPAEPTGARIVVARANV